MKKTYITLGLVLCFVMSLKRTEKNQSYTWFYPTILIILQVSIVFGKRLLFFSDILTNETRNYCIIERIDTPYVLKLCQSLLSVVRIINNSKGGTYGDPVVLFINIMLREYHSFSLFF